MLSVEKAYGKINLSLPGRGLSARIVENLTFALGLAKTLPV